ncbi:MAG: Dabb family protein [Bacteroidales bacterium]|nr:Dabb family protein [Bacteroidales bacterium]
MIKHIVFFKIKTQNKQEDLKELKKMIDDLGTSIPSVINIEAGINFSPRESAFDLALFAEFNDEQGLKEYQVHPQHVKLIDHLGKLDKEIAVVDYMVQD